MRNTRSCLCIIYHIFHIYAADSNILWNICEFNYIKKKLGDDE